jgi:hypothetical protein
MPITLFKATLKPATKTKEACVVIQRMDLNDKPEEFILDRTAQNGMVRRAIVQYCARRGPHYWAPKTEDELEYIGDEKNCRVTYYITQ